VFDLPEGQKQEYLFMFDLPEGEMQGYLWCFISGGTKTVILKVLVLLSPEDKKPE
jgi:hypothetical protein